MSQKPEDNGTLRESSGVGGSRGYWERQKLVATKWTTNSTMSIAKAANENGMPEPPQSYFETQDRLVRFFEEHGELKAVEPNEVVIEMGTDLDHLYIIEEGVLIAEKDMVVVARSAKKAERSVVLEDKLEEKRAYNMQKKAQPKPRGEEGGASSGAGADEAEQQQEEGRDASIKEAAEAEAFPPASDAAAEHEAAVYEEALKAAVSEHKPPPTEVIHLSTLEQNEMVGDVPLIEGTAVEMRYRADPSEGAALRVLPRKKLVAEMYRDPIFAGNVFRNMAITLSVKCEEICWRLEDMAVEASSKAWRTGMRKRHKQKYAVAPKEAKRLQELLGVPEEERLHHSTTASFEQTMRVHGSLLVFSESLCFYARVFGMVRTRTRTRTRTRPRTRTRTRTRTRSPDPEPNPKPNPKPSPFPSPNPRWSRRCSRSRASSPCCATRPPSRTSRRRSRSRSTRRRSSSPRSPTSPTRARHSTRCTAHTPEGSAASRSPDPSPDPSPANPNPHEVLTLRDQRRRGTTNQTLELMSPEAREAAKRTTQAPQAPAQR